MRRPSLAALALHTSLAALWTGAAAAQGAPSLARMEEDSEKIANAYLRVWSSNDGEAVSGVPYIYGDRVLFYGRAYSKRDLAAEKRRFIQRWPIRRYTHRPGTMRVICNQETLKCAARSTIDWTVANPRRNARSSGSSTFDLGISFAGPQPVVQYETGAVIARGGRG